MSFSEAMYQVEEIYCENIKKNIAELLSLDSKFVPFYNHVETNEVVVISEIYEKIHYSVALASLLDYVYEKYKEFRSE